MPYDSTIINPDDFWKYVLKTDDCWLWAGTRYVDQYGMYQSRRAHRIAWELTHGPIPEGMYVCHTCDRHWCVNPSHLFLGTPKDNMLDMSAKGRRNDDAKALRTRGQGHYRAKLTDDDIRAIRQRYAAGERLSDIARAYRISHTHARDIALRRRWRHVED